MYRSAVNISCDFMADIQAVKRSDFGLDEPVECLADILANQV